MDNVYTLLLSDYMKLNNLLYIKIYPLNYSDNNYNLRFVDNLDGHWNKTVQRLRLLCSESS